MSTTVKFGGAPSCQKCSKSVYFTEQVTGPGGMYHKTCLTCSECSKRLDSTLLCEKEGKPWCKGCYGKLFGPKGFGFGVLSQTQPESPSSATTPTGGKGVSPSVATLVDAAQSPSVSTPTTAAKEDVSKSSESIASRKGSVGGLPKWGGGSGGGCPVCSKPVYFAEQIIGPGGIKYHKLCFKCSECNKLVDASSMADKDNLIYCKACHGKKFGPKGYGFGVLNTERAS